MESTFVVLKI